MDCEGPLRAVCHERCGYVAYWRCDTYGCEPCGERKRRRLTQLVDQGSAIHLQDGKVGYFLTLTAPGTRTHKRWQQGKQQGRQRKDCDCHRHGLSDGLWNAGESGDWNRLRTALTRDRTVTFAAAVETQKRGMLHRHVLLFSDGPLFFEEVQAQALAAGYGCIVDLEPVRSSAKAARYISKYVSKSSGERSQVAWEHLDSDTGEVIGKRATYRLWSSSRDWGVTMREIKATQTAQARARARYLAELQQLVGDEAGTTPSECGQAQTAAPTGPP